MRIEDKAQLSALDRQKNIFYYARIIVLDKDEEPIQTIEGKVQPGSSVSINGSSSVRRTCNITLIADEVKNDLTDIDNLLSVNKKIKIYTGIKQTIDFSKDIIYYTPSDSMVDESPRSVIQTGQNGKIYINRKNKIYLKEEDGKTVFDYKSHKDFPMYYYDMTTGLFVKINSFAESENIIFWFPLGVYVITQPSLTSDANGCKISLSCQDKMCLLNGTMGGTLPASVVFDQYDQEIGHVYLEDNQVLVYPPVDHPNDYNVYHFNNKTYMYDIKFGWQEVEAENIPEVVSKQQLIYDIVYTCVVNYGNEPANKVMVNDIPKEIKQIVRYLGTSPLYYNNQGDIYTFDESQVTDTDNWTIFHYNDEIGYSWIDFVFPGKTESNGKTSSALTTSLGDNVCTVLDKIVQVLGNYEYFYDIDGNFVFQEIKNYLNNSYNPLKDERNMKPYYIDNNKSVGSRHIENNNILLIGEENYQVDFFGDQKSVYTFTEGNDLVTAYTNNPDYTNLKNDYHIWGKNQNGNVIHYHIAIKDKPKKEYFPELGDYAYPIHEVIFKKDNDKVYTGKIRKIQKEDFTGTYATIIGQDLNCKDPNAIYVQGKTMYYNKDITKSGFGTSQTAVDNTPNQQKEFYKLSIKNNGVLKQIRANDWRAELYLQGLEKVHDGDRPDMYEQELLDWFDTIYEWGYYRNPDAAVKIDSDFVFEGRFKTDITSTPNELNYFIDYLEPIDLLYGMSVDDIGSKIYTLQEDKIIKLYDDEVPDVILINSGWQDQYKNKIKQDCDSQGQPFSFIDANLFSSLAESIAGYTAQEKTRNALYQYTTYNESITIQSLPIYYLDVNQRITVEDNKTGIHGDFIIKSISLPLVPNSTMSIAAVTAINRI